MKKSLRAVAGVVAVLAVGAAAGTASAATRPTYYTYKKCSSKILCQGLAVTNGTGSKVAALQLGPKCRLKGSKATAYNNRQYTVSKGAFTAKLRLTSYDSGVLEGEAATVTVRGTVVNKVRMRLNYTIVGKLVPGCSNVAKTGSIVLPFAGVARGG